MELKNIFTILGKPGLFKSISETKSGVIVESLTDGKRFQAFTIEKISCIGEISIYTQTGEKIIADIFKQIYEVYKGKAPFDNKTDDNKLKEFFLSIEPDYDSDRVYPSHIKKIINWYNILIDKGVTEFIVDSKTESEKQEEEKNEVVAEVTAEKVETAEVKEAEKKPAKAKAAPKTSSAKTATAKKTDAKSKENK